MTGLTEFVLDVGTNDARGVLWPQRELLCLLACSARTVFPGVHLFRNDICFFAYSAHEELGSFEDGGPDLAKAVAAENGACGGLNAIPKFRIRGQ